MLLSRVEIQTRAPEEVELAPRQPTNMQETREDPALRGTDGQPKGNGADESPMPPPKAQPIRRPSPSAMNPGDPSTWGKIPRNARCPCGSGRKYKHCHGKVA